MRGALPAVVAALALAGCAAYAPQPLPGRVSLATDAGALTVDAAALPFRGLATHPFDPADGLDMDEVAMLAVANNPQLRQARDAVGVARAQAFAAGLLPDPQLGVTFDHPTNGTAGNTNAFNLNPTFDASALFLRASRRGAAQAETRRVELDLLWQEWQVVSQARLLFARIQAQETVRAGLESERSLLSERYRHGREALAAGNVTIDFTATLLAALQNIEKQINDLERSLLQDRGRLNALLGVVPAAPLALTGKPQARVLDAAGVRADLEQRLAARPDLRALQAGYRSQEDKFRGAVLAQFPALNVGLTRARDTSGLYTVGFGLTLSLPVLNANRGNIAIQRTTRRKLFDEYQARLDAAYGEVGVALENQPLLEAQLRRVRAALGELGAVAARAEAAFRSGNFAAADYARLRIALIDKQTEEINLQEALMEQRIALETLLGPGLPEAPEGAAR